MNHVAVNVQSNGGYWQAQWRDDLGCKHRRSLGAKAKFSLRQARVMAKRLEAELNANGRQARGEVAPALGEFLDRYFAQRADLAASTRKLHEHTAHMLRQHFGKDLGIDRITKTAANDWRVLVGAGAFSPRDNISENTVRKHCRNAHTIFELARAEDVISSNPFKLPRRQTTARDVEWFYVSVDLTERLIAGCECPKRRAMLALWRYAGLRQGEAFQVNWSHIDWEASLLTIYAKKTGRRRQIPLTPRLAEKILTGVYSEAQLGGDIVLTGISSNAKNLRRWFDGLCERVGATPWPEWCQVMRRSRATDWATEGIDIHSAAKWMGHSIAVMQPYYLQVPLETIERVTRPERPQNRPQSDARRNADRRKSLSRLNDRGGIRTHNQRLKRPMLCR